MPNDHLEKKWVYTAEYIIKDLSHGITVQMLYYLVESNGELELVLEATREIVGKPVDVIRNYKCCQFVREGLRKSALQCRLLLISVAAVYMVRAKYPNCVILSNAIQAYSGSTQ